jgi:hypothetical protein
VVRLLIISVFTMMSFSAFALCCRQDSVAPYDQQVCAQYGLTWIEGGRDCKEPRPDGSKLKCKDGSIATFAVLSSLQANECLKQGGQVEAVNGVRVCCGAGKPADGKPAGK